jgi:chromosome segregation ATPase
MRIGPKDGDSPKVDDSAIARLEREIAEERDNSARLLSEIRELKFKTEILERSYAKQLQDARVRAESAEKALNDQRTRNAELDSLRNDAIELLNDTKTEIDRLTKERNQLHKQLTSKSGYTVEGAEDEAGENDGEGTINTLLNDAGWLKRRRPGKEAQAKADAEAAARAAEEAQAGNMLDPDTYMKAKGKND